MARLNICSKCKKPVILCQGHLPLPKQVEQFLSDVVEASRPTPEAHPTVIGTRDIELFDETTLSTKRAWQVPSLKDGTLQFIPMDRMAGYLTTFFQHLYRDFQPIVEIPPDIPVPDGEELLPFQREDIYTMLRMHRNNQNILNANEMGLGKTIEMLCFINLINPNKVLVICPNSLKFNWKREAERWLVRKYDMEIAGTGLCTFSDFTIINYEALRVWGLPLATTSWDLVIIDEAHFVKNPSSQRAKAVFNIPGTRLVMLTGTPIVNYPYELFPLVHYLDKKHWGSIQAFERDFTWRGSRYARNLPRLQQKLRETVMLRHLKKDVLKELPRKRRQIIEFSSEGFEALLEEEKKAWQAKDNDFSKTEVVNELNKMLFADGGGMNDAEFAKAIENLKYDKRYFFEQIAKIRHKVAQAKVPLVLEHLDNALDYIPGIKSEADNKVVVFGHHRDVLTAIAKHYGDMAVLVMGGENIADRDAKVKRFQTDPACRVFVGGMTVAGVGITLTAASHVVFAEMDWVPGTLTQCEDRCHRIGQEADSLLIQHLVLENSLDAYMGKTLIRKQGQIDKAVNIQGGTAA